MDPQEDPIVIDDALWERLIELTGGEAALCYQCGVCTATCPWGLVKEETVSVREFIRRVQLGLETTAALWLCTTCAKCEAYCPRGVSIASIFQALRSIAWENRKTPEGLSSLLWSEFWNDNPWEQPPSQRAQWAKDLEVPHFDPEQHEILLYIGSTPAYDRRAQQVAKALVKALRASGVAFGILGEAEPESGSDVLDIGHRAYFEDIARASATTFREQGVAHLVTISPHDYDAFHNHYPVVSDAFHPQHYTQYLAALLDSGRLTLTHRVERTVTFHDPCYLARHNAETKAPRAVLDAIPGLTVVEMNDAGVDTLCCGGGGGRMWLETEAGERFSDLRVAEALETGSGLLATACPFCIACLEDSLKAQKITDLLVKDIAEIVALAL
ncbi:MAG: 4Fe-4S dicluster domain-containing protein [Anaerolineae bacterium]|nr:4Fe-4S dicluster domain-containing protein [Anaerolineae bacterium]